MSGGGEEKGSGRQYQIYLGVGGGVFGGNRVIGMWSGRQDSGSLKESLRTIVLDSAFKKKKKRWCSS